MIVRLVVRGRAPGLAVGRRWRPGFRPPISFTVAPGNNPGDERSGTPVLTLAVLVAPGPTVPSVDRLRLGAVGVTKISNIPLS